MIYAQESLIDEIIVDNFAGGGGASTGIELATGSPLRKCRVPAHGNGPGEGKPPGVVRRDHNHNGAAAGLRGGVRC